LTEITIPNSVTNIGNSAFSSCTALADVWVNWAIPLPIEKEKYWDGTDAFAVFSGVNIENVNLHVPEGTQCLYAATSVWQDFIIVGEQEKLSQEIDFPEIPTKTYGDEPVILPLTSDAGLPISYQSSNTTVAMVSGNILTITGAGTAYITAKQSGDCTYEAATQIV